MKQKMNIGAALLALCLLLSACGGKQKGEDPKKLSGSGIYTADIAPLELPLTELTAAGAGGGSLYLAGTEELEEEMEEGGAFTSGSSFTTTTGDDGGFTFSSGGMGRSALYRLDASTGEAVKLEGYAPESGIFVTAIVPCGDGTLWVLEQAGGMETLSLGDFADMGSASASLGGFDVTSRIWRHLSADGSQELERVDITDLAGKLGVTSVTDTRMDASGCLYAASGSTVTALDTGLSTLFACTCPEPVERLASLADGGVGAVTGSDGGRTLFPVDPESRQLGAACPLTGNVREICAGNEVYSFLYRSGDSLYGWPRGASAPEKLLSWSGAGVDSGQVMAAAVLEDGQVAALLWDGSGWPVACSLARLTPADAEDLAGRTTLTLATLGMNSETRTRVLEFNRTNSRYRIEIRDYSEYNTADNVSAGLTKLNTEILAGNMPDLLDVTDGLPLRQYAVRGMLEDLWPFIESDPDLGREGVMERVLEADEIDGKLCRVFPRFALETVAGSSAVVGERTGWTLDELKSVLEGQPAGCGVLGVGETRNSILENLFSHDLDKFVDWTAGTVRFDSQEFREILEFCCTFPARSGGAGSSGSGAVMVETAESAGEAYARVAQGDQLLLPVYLNDWSSIQLYRQLFGGGVSFVGYPGSGRTGVRFHVDGGIALSSACKDKEGAWSFLRQALLPKEEKFSLDFPVNRADFEREAQESMVVEYVKDENGCEITGPDGKPIKEGVSFVFIGGQMIAIEPATQADCDQVMALYEAASSVSGRDENIWTIVQECAGACFAGDQTVENASRTIQNRVELYLNEQR